MYNHALRSSFVLNEYIPADFQDCPALSLATYYLRNLIHGKHGRIHGQRKLIQNQVKELKRFKASQVFET